MIDIDPRTPNLGAEPAPSAGRDCVHVAVAPVLAGCRLWPGARVLVGKDDGRAYLAQGHEHAHGIVDPFLPAGSFVQSGRKFWLFLLPGTITGMRHVWQHPAFAPKPLPVARPAPALRVRAVPLGELDDSEVL